MSDASPAPEGRESDLPEALEDEVLRILDGDEADQPAALRQLLDAHQDHARTIRAWLTKVGIDLPNVITTGGTSITGGDLETLPQQLGRYRLIEKLGRGGFGTVYRAEQQEPFVRPVAIKVLNPGMDSREVLARFATEREALNRMDHPGIARLLDAGSTPQGRPFFVMEVVDGVPLAIHCRQHKLPLRERLELFLLVCDAMQHAHQKAVLHRDLSSNNVLVTEIGGRLQPKIIDFGIAKSLADPLPGAAMTFQGTLMGTPEFMSPEQAAGDNSDIDTRADVYALGVQLYELLTDQLPIPSHILRAQGIAGMARVIRDHQPTPPSELSVQRQRAELRGDLDAITMHALAKLRDERYATVTELADDIRAHLANEPIAAIQPSDWYRFKKLVRRNRAESAVVALLALGLVAATGVLWWALSTANRALADAELQKQEIERRADAGFRLLGNEERLHAATAAAATLPPPWPRHQAALRNWLTRHGTPLEEELPKLASKLRELEDRGFSDLADQHLHAALLRLQADLERFVAGPLARVRGKLALLTERVQPWLTQESATWQQTIDGVRQHYRGFSLTPVPGLAPLGRDPRSGLYEFLDLCSHAASSPVPVRDPESGRLECGPDTGIVFVLAPADTFRIGAFRDRPGLPQDDPDAGDDELGGQLVHLDDFLIARTELTRAQWARLNGEPPPADALLPVTGIDWHTARSVLGEFDLDLPTEAQWEYACRATTTTPWTTGNSAAGVAAQGWFGATPQAVALLAGNRFGLFDCHGNVSEWCRDEKLPYREFEPRSNDGLRQRATTAIEAPRVVRGGSCYRGPLAARCSAREARDPDTRDNGIGIRPVRRLR